MLALVIVLAVTNLAAVAALIALYRLIDGKVADTPDAVVAAALDASAATPTSGATSTTRTRRLISIEVLNPIELAGSRGRLAGLAGSIAPRLTRRIVNDQVVKILRDQLVEQQVVADVRLHTVHPVRPSGHDEPQVYADEVAPVELSDDVSRD